MAQSALTDAMRSYTDDGYGELAGKNVSKTRAIMPGIN